MLTKEGFMRPQGLAAVACAKKNGTWSALDDVENLQMPADLIESLRAKEKLSAWEEKSRSWKRGRLEMLLNAKREDTRHKRISKFLEELSL